MSLYWSLAPIFALATVFLAVAGRPRSSSPQVCSVLGAAFFLMGVLGLTAESGLSSAIATGVLFLLAGLPFASAGVALWGRFIVRRATTAFSSATA